MVSFARTWSRLFYLLICFVGVFTQEWGTRKYKLSNRLVRRCNFFKCVDKNFNSLNFGLEVIDVDRLFVPTIFRRKLSTLSAKTRKSVQNIAV